MAVCRWCGETTNDHVYLDGTAECDRCLADRSTPWCIDCGRDHHGDCGDVLLAEALGETVGESAERFLGTGGDA
jgi:hypothetical protein